MDDHQHHIVIALIAKLRTRTEEQAEALSTALTRHCWPAHGTDRREPVAAEWLRRWSPRPGLGPLRPCTCAGGHCGVCN
jgi:hypothetical protein